MKNTLSSQTGNSTTCNMGWGSSHKPAIDGKNALGVTPQIVTRKSQGVTPAHRTRHYKPRARKCKAPGCNAVFTPLAKHGKFCSDRCRKRAARACDAKARRTQPKPVPKFALAVCAHCGNTFLATTGKGAKFCKASHKQAAYKVRRAAASAALALDFGTGLTYEAAADLVETLGLKRIGNYLKSRGFGYSETSRQWIKQEERAYP